MDKYLVTLHRADGGCIGNGIYEASSRQEAFVEAEENRKKYHPDASYIQVSQEPVDQCEECKYLIDSDGCACP